MGWKYMLSDSLNTALDYQELVAVDLLGVDESNMGTGAILPLFLHEEPGVISAKTACEIGQWIEASIETIVAAEQRRRLTMETLDSTHSLRMTESQLVTSHRQFLQAAARWLQQAGPVQLTDERPDVRVVGDVVRRANAELFWAHNRLC